MVEGLLDFMFPCSLDKFANFLSLDIFSLFLLSFSINVNVVAMEFFSLLDTLIDTASEFCLNSISDLALFELTLEFGAITFVMDTFAYSLSSFQLADISIGSIGYNLESFFSIICIILFPGLESEFHLSLNKGLTFHPSQLPHVDVFRYLELFVSLNLVLDHIEVFKNDSWSLIAYFVVCIVCICDYGLVFLGLVKDLFFHKLRVINSVWVNFLKELSSSLCPGFNYSKLKSDAVNKSNNISVLDVAKLLEHAIKMEKF